MSITNNVIASYTAPREVFRRLLAHGRREDRALVFLMVACGLGFVAQWPRLARYAALSDDIPLQGYLVGALFVWMFLVPLLSYGLAGLLHLGMLALRRSSSWFATRMVLFWTMLAVTPLSLLQGLLAGIAGQGAGAGLIGFVVLLAFVYILVQGLREVARTHAATAVSA